MIQSIVSTQYLRGYPKTMIGAHFQTLRKLCMGTSVHSSRGVSTTLKDHVFSLFVSVLFVRNYIFTWTGSLASAWAEVEAQRRKSPQVSTSQQWNKFVEERIYILAWKSLITTERISKANCGQSCLGTATGTSRHTCCLTGLAT